MGSGQMGLVNRRVIMKASNIFFGAVGVCFFTSTTLASNVPDGDIVTFSPNATAKAAEVNQNFTKL